MWAFLDVLISYAKSPKRRFEVDFDVLSFTNTLYILYTNYISLYI